MMCPAYSISNSQRLLLSTVRGRNPAVRGWNVAVGRQNAPIFEHGLDRRFAPCPGRVHLGKVFGVTAREHHLAEAIAVGACQSTVLFETRKCVVIHHLAPQAGIVSRRVPAPPDMRELARAITRRHMPEGELRVMARLELHLI